MANPPKPKPEPKFKAVIPKQATPLTNNQLSQAVAENVRRVWQS